MTVYMDGRIDTSAEEDLVLGMLIHESDVPTPIREQRQIIRPIFNAHSWEHEGRKYGINPSDVLMLLPNPRRGFELLGLLLDLQRAGMCPRVFFVTRENEKGLTVARLDDLMLVFTTLYPPSPGEQT